MKKEFYPLLKYIKEYKAKLILAVLAMFIVSFSETMVGYLNGHALEAVVNNKLWEGLLFLGIYFVTSVFVEALLSSWFSSTISKIENSLIRKLGYFTYAKALNLPAYAYEEKTSGEIINRIVNDTQSFSYVFERLITTVTGLFGTIIVFVYILFNSWIVALEIVVFLLILWRVVAYFTPQLGSIYKKRKQEYDGFISLVNESIRGIRELKTLGLKNRLKGEIADVSKKIYTVQEKQINLEKKYNLITRIMRVSLEITVFITSIILLYYKQVNVTFFVAMTYYIYRFMWIIENIDDLSKMLEDVKVSLERVNEILENRLYEDVKFGTKTLENAIGVIEFKNVTFKYPNEDATLNNFNLEVEPGKKNRDCWC